MKNQSHSTQLQNLLYSLYAYSLRDEFKQERQVAREFFLISTGKVYDDDPAFENRMAYFQEFFLFEFRLSEIFSGSTIFETFLFNSLNVFSLKEVQHYEELRNQTHSLFRVISTHENYYLMIKDLLSLRTYRVFPLPSFAFGGLDKNQIFDARMIEYYGVFYLTGAFVLHSKNVYSFIEKKIKKLFKNPDYCQAEHATYWKEELENRNKLFTIMTQQKIQIEQMERKRAVDYLNITKQMVDMPRNVESKNLVMSLGIDEYVSPFVPESPFYNTLLLLHQLAFSEVRCYRYRHIDPLEIYELEDKKGLELLEKEKWKNGPARVEG